MDQRDQTPKSEPCPLWFESEREGAIPAWLESGRLPGIDHDLRRGDRHDRQTVADAGPVAGHSRRCPGGRFLGGASVQPGPADRLSAPPPRVDQDPAAHHCHRRTARASAESGGRTNESVPRTMWRCAAHPDQSSSGWFNRARKLSPSPPRNLRLFEIQIPATVIPNDLALSIIDWSRQRIACVFRLSAMAK